MIFHEKFIWFSLQGSVFMTTINYREYYRKHRMTIESLKPIYQQPDSKKPN